MVYCAPSIQPSRSNLIDFIIPDIFFNYISYINYEIYIN